MTKTQSIKTWITSHKEEIFVGTVMTAFTAGCVALFVYAVKVQNEEISEYNKQIKDRHNWINDQFASQKDVYQLADGGYFSLPVSSREDITVM